MTEEKQRIAIAKICGFDIEKRAKQIQLALDEDANIGIDPWPDYLASLDSIVEVSRNLPNDGTRLRFVEELASLQTSHHPFFSTPKEWCEALLKTLNLWKE